ncbi:hypothetical protein [Nocardioides pacificus]
MRRWLTALGLAVAVLGPVLLLPGYTLRGDMVFTPQQPWKDAWLGLDGSVPRAVPMDALVSLATQVVPGWVVQRVLLGGALVAGVLGVERMLAAYPWFARLGASVLWVWNPWVAERLLIGQWATVVGYCLLPWVVLAAAAMRDDVRRGWTGLTLILALSAVASPSSGLMAGLVAVCVVAGRRRALGLTVALWILTNLPWVVPGLLAVSAASGGADGFDEFAARGESLAGVVASLLSLGGIWKSSIHPDERTSALLVLASCVLTLVALLGLRSAAHRPGQQGTTRALGVVAVVSFAVALLPAAPGGADLLARIADVLPGMAMLRDSHRFLAPAVLVMLPGLAGALVWLRERAGSGREALLAVVGLVVVLPVLLLPSLAWGAAGRLEPVDYPQEWFDVASLLEQEGPARTVVLPWTGSYRGFEWNDHRAVLDPAPRFFPGEVLIDDRVLLGEDVIASEDPALERVTAALAAPDQAAALRAEGVRWVLVEKGHRTGRIPEGDIIHEGQGLRLLDLGATVAPDRPITGRTGIATAMLLTGLVVGAAWVTRVRHTM